MNTPKKNVSEQVSPSKPTVREPTIIGPTIRIRGTVHISGNQSVHVEGCVEGTVSLDNMLSVGTEGRIDADVRARAIVIAGEVVGDLQADEQVVIQRTAKVLGNIAAPRVTLKDGCKFKGSIDTEASSRTAIVKSGSTGRAESLSGGDAAGKGVHSTSGRGTRVRTSERSVGEPGARPDRQ